jgi:hypothetical protein
MSNLKEALHQAMNEAKWQPPPARAGKNNDYWISLNMRCSENDHSREQTCLVSPRR